jgi:DNA-binding HxlR family transcriptional regulator
MSKYGQYCPVAKALEIIGDRWTLLIIRDMLAGMNHFNDLERGLPGISRALLTARLRQLQQAGIIEKHFISTGRKTTEYHLTQAGTELLDVIAELVVWGAKWAFGDPTPEDLNPVLLMWWMKDGVNTEQLPQQRVVIQFNFQSKMLEAFWLILTAEDVSICLTDPGYEIQVLVTANLATYFQLWAGRITYSEALTKYGISVEGLPQFVRAFPGWFTWSHAAEEVYSLRSL